jgi:hypothetical protein
VIHVIVVVLIHVTQIVIYDHVLSLWVSKVLADDIIADYVLSTSCTSLHKNIFTFVNCHLS